MRAWGAEVAIVLGSGLAGIVEDLEVIEQLPYADFPELPKPAVAGHGGRFVFATIGGTRIVCALGRVHLYEGHPAAAVTAGVRLLAESGIKRLVLTNAAGSANRAFAPGSWMMLNDHLNLTGTTPLLGEPAFIDMTETYSATWRDQFSAAARRAEITLHEGVYAGLLGPQYETPAEVRMLQRLGADAVGMSTVLEAIQARALGLEVAGFSCLTNWAAGLTSEALSHEEVLTTGRAAAKHFRRLLAAVL